jgi:hypothetical protein
MQRKIIYVLGGVMTLEEYVCICRVTELTFGIYFFLSVQENTLLPVKVLVNF